MKNQASLQTSLQIRQLKQNNKTKAPIFKAICLFLILTNLYHQTKAQSVGCAVSINYCSSLAGIDNFTIAGENGTGINNSTGCSGYTVNDYTNLPEVELFMGSIYTFSLTPNSLTTPMNTAIFIDWNKDNDYLDAGEFYNFGTTTGVLNTSINVPLMAQPNTYTFAVMSAFDGIGFGTPIVQTNYCTTSFLLGEFEEYTLEVVPCIGLQGCTDVTYCEFDPDAVCNDGTCLTLAIKGCTNANFCEYNPIANCDDGSCLTSNSDPGTCNTDCTLGNIESWNNLTCACEDSIRFPGIFPASFNLSTLNGTNGFVITGISEGDCLGSSISYAGDINNDSVDDLIIGAPAANRNGSSNIGESYVLFGSNNSFSSSLNLSSLNGSNGFRINGIDSNDESGYSVSHASDINADGIDDLIIGAYLADPNGIDFAGESYVIFGKASPFSDSLNLSALNGTNGFVMNGIDNGDLSGNSVSSAGDINSDGIDDLIVAAYNAEPNGNLNAGETYIVFGKSNPFSASLNLSTLNGTNGFVINGIETGDWSGTSVSNAGDINADGIDDIIIGAFGGNSNGNTQAGESYVVFGKASPFSASLNLSALNGTNGFVINGIESGDLSGSSVSNAGDINADGIDDLIIGAYKADPNENGEAGESYVVFGKSTPYDASLNLSTLNGSNGFVIIGIDMLDNSGFSVSNAGDINGDAIDDVIIGAFQADPNGFSSGESYVFFGKTSPFSASLDLSSLNGTNGFVINGIQAGDLSGISVNNAGDINSDGIDDVIIGANKADPNGNFNAGESYVLFGRNSKIQGCTDYLATNYNPYANCDDGSCIIPCIPLACNTDCTTGDIEVFNTASCQCEVSIVSISGCTDASSCNYNPIANCDDGSCGFILGCTNPNYCEYVPNATCDDGTCITLNNTTINVFNTAVPPTNTASDNGYIQLTVLGGSGSYIYTWIPNVSSNNFASNLGYGTYTVTVQDAILCGSASQTLTFASPNCPSVLNFSNANPSTNSIEQADDIIMSSEALNSNKTYKAGYYQTIEYIELQQGFSTGLNNFEAQNEDCEID